MLSTIFRKFAYVDDLALFHSCKRLEGLKRASKQDYSFRVFSELVIEPKSFKDGDSSLLFKQLRSQTRVESLQKR